MSEQPPVAPRRPVVRRHHGDEVVDEYEWLRDAEDPDTIAYLEAENAWAERQTKVEHLDPPFGGDHDVRRFEIPVNDAVRVRGGDGVGDLNGVP